MCVCVDLFFCYKKVKQENFHQNKVKQEYDGKKQFNSLLVIKYAYFICHELLICC